MKYTVHELAKLADITVRTLHYYDEIGLLKPSRIAANGYRYYEENELLKLQQILFFRELDFSLEDIKKMLQNSNFRVVDALKDQRKLLKLKQKRIDGLVNTINKTINRMTKQQKMNDEELYDAFKDEDVKQYQAEVKQRWGNTDAYKQSMAKVSKMTKKEMDQLKKDGDAFNKELAKAMDKPIVSREVQDLIEKHYQGINFFYECSLDMYKNLGQMYVDDPRFTATYDKYRPGLAQFLRDAINYFCEHRQK